MTKCRNSDKPESQEGVFIMAVFITGGYGHIASWVAYLLAKEGKEVIIYDTQPRMRRTILKRLRPSCGLSKGMSWTFPFWPGP